MTRDETEEALREIWMRSRQSLKGRIEVLERAAGTLLEDRLAPETRQAAREEAHRLAGSLGSFGIPQGSEHARAVEERLADDRPFAPEEVTAFCDRIVQIARLFEDHDKLLWMRDTAVLSTPRTQQGATEGATHGVQEWGEDRTPPDQVRRHTVWLVGVEPRQSRRLHDRLASRGWILLEHRDAGEAEQALRQGLPDMLLVAMGPTTRDTAARLIATTRQVGPSVLILALGGEARLDDRVAAAKAGADRYLDAAIPPEDIIKTLDGLAKEKDATRHRILVVDDDRTTLDLLTATLNGAGYEVDAIDDPNRFWTTLQQAPPELVLLDMDMPHHDGLALCRALRTDPRWDALPVVFVSAHADPELRQEIWDAGGDDFLHKPVGDERLLHCVRNRLKRRDTVLQVGHSDPESGLPGSAVGQEEAARMLSIAQRQHQVLSIALVHWAAAGDTEVEPHIVSHLRRALLSEDLLFSHGPGIAAVAYGTERERLIERLQGALYRIHEATGADCKAAVSGYPADGDSLARLMASAEKTLGGMAGAPPATVRSTGSDAGPVERPDIVVVDDDETVAALLRHTLESNGYSVTWVPDGLDAVRLLGGAAPRLRPRLVLLDVNLPGLDGLSILRRLRDEGALDRLKVIMLTVRSLESEVVKALRDGADDHVSKPFSTPVLLQRIQKAIGR